MAQVLAGSTNAATGACPTGDTVNDRLPDGPILDCYSEYLPTAPTWQRHRRNAGPPPR